VLTGRVTISRPGGDGVMVEPGEPFVLHHGVGDGWLYVGGVVVDPLARLALPLLAEHAANALYTAATQSAPERPPAVRIRQL